MRIWFWFTAVCSVAAASVSVAQAPLPMLNGLPELKDYTAQRSSSADPNWQNGNGDARPIAPGQTLTLADLKGPGRITHIWFTIASNERFYGRKLVLRMYWDGERTPSVDVPVNDFFSQGHGLDMNVNSLPFRVTADGRARNCYFVMPFRKSARITMTNEGDEPCHALYWYIDWQKVKRLPARTATFHAQYRQQFPCVKGEDYTILEAVGEGHFVGCMLSIRQRTDSWWGEGDDFFYIDGEEVPSLKGTGTEDYFCDAWGLRQQDGLFYGAPLVEGMLTGDRTTAYRFHIPDPVPFKKSLRMTIEHKGVKFLEGGQIDGFAERFDDYSSVAYWYQLEPHAPFPMLPKVSERLPPMRNARLIEGESLLDQAVTVGPAPTRQEGAWNGGAQLWFLPRELPASIEIPFTVPEDGQYRLSLALTRSWDYGTYRLSLNGEIIRRSIDLYAPSVTNQNLRLAARPLKAGRHVLTFECIGHNPMSDGYLLGLDYIEMESIE